MFRSGKNSVVEIQILHIEDCPNWSEAASRLRDALAATGHPDVVITYRLLRTAADAEGTVFAGSPTITLDGIDLFPTAGVTSDLACRVYRTPFGLAGLPTTEQLIERITVHE
jgi:hypothetical protein